MQRVERPYLTPEGVASLRDKEAAGWHRLDPSLPLHHLSSDSLAPSEKVESNLDKRIEEAKRRAA